MELLVSIFAVVIAVSCLVFAMRSDLVEQLRSKVKGTPFDPNNKDDHDQNDHED